MSVDDYIQSLEARLALRNAELAATKTELASTKASLALRNYISGDFQRDKIPVFDFNPPQGVTMNQDGIQEAKTIILEFNAQKKVTEQSGSIERKNSVHFLWANLIRIVTRDDTEVFWRVVYEWAIQHPIKDSWQYIDFTFVPAKRSHLNWLDYMGGLELKNNPTSAKATGTLRTLGLNQAIRRAAMCILARSEESKWTGAHVASCCFADGQQFGIARIRIDEDKVVSADVFGPILLPGVKGNDDLKALLILKHILTSSPFDHQDIMSAPVQHQPATKTVTGFLASRDKDPVELGPEGASWQLGEFLGQGSFAIVYGVVDDEARVHTDVIKVVRRKDHARKLAAELSCLSELSKQEAARAFFPRVVEAIADGESSIVALCLSPRGISVPKFIDMITKIGNYNVDIERLPWLIGPSIIHALKAAHEAGFYDVRAANILIVPPPDIMRSLSSATRDMVHAELELMQNIKLEECSFVLNDWGETTNLSTKPKDQVTNDLTMLIKTLSNLRSVPDSTDLGSEKSKKSPVNQVSAAGHIAIDIDIVAWLNKLAADMNYEALIAELGSLGSTGNLLVVHHDEASSSGSQQPAQKKRRT